jgi:P-type Cu+ transporter
MAKDRVSGHGLKATYSNHTIMIGNRKMTEDNQIVVTESVDAKLSEFEKESKTAVLVAIDNTLLGIKITLF